MEEKYLTLYVYELEDGKPVDYDITNSNQPKKDCLTFKISLKESLQVEKLRIENTDLIPVVSHDGELKDVTEGEFGYELVEPE